VSENSQVVTRGDARQTLARFLRLHDWGIRIDVLAPAIGGDRGNESLSPPHGSLIPIQQMRGSGGEWKSPRPPLSLAHAGMFTRGVGVGECYGEAFGAGDPEQAPPGEYITRAGRDPRAKMPAQLFREVDPRQEGRLASSALGASVDAQICVDRLQLDIRS
jgi:hypothetical protein